MARDPHIIADEELEDEPGLIDDSRSEALESADDDDDASTAAAETPANDDDTDPAQVPAPEADDDDASEPAHDDEASDEASDDDEAPGQEDGEEEDEEEFESEPFAELEGALHYKGSGVLVPEGPALERLRQQLGLAAHGSGRMSELERELEELRTTRTAETEVAGDVLELVFKDFATMDEDALYEWVVNFKANEAKLREQIRSKYLDRREAELNARATRRDPAELQRAAEAEQAQVATAATATLETLYQRPELATLTAADKTVLATRVQARLAQLTRVAADASLEQFGIKQGEPYLDAQQMYEWALDRAEARADERGRRTNAKAVADVNRRKLGKAGGTKAPAGPGKGRTKAADGEPAYTPPKDRAEWLARMEMD